MLRKLALAAAFTSLVMGCTPSAQEKPIENAGVEASGDLELWHFFSDREEKALNEILDDFRKKHPKVNLVAKGFQPRHQASLSPVFVKLQQQPRSPAVPVPRFAHYVDQSEEPR